MLIQVTSRKSLHVIESFLPLCHIYQIWSAAIFHGNFVTWFLFCGRFVSVSLWVGTYWAIVFVAGFPSDWMKSISSHIKNYLAWWNSQPATQFLADLIADIVRLSFSNFTGIVSKIVVSVEAIAETSISHEIPIDGLIWTDCCCYLFLCLQHSHLHTPSLPTLPTISVSYTHLTLPTSDLV